MVIIMTGTLTFIGGDIVASEAKTDYQVQVPLAPAVFSSGTWTITDSSNVLFVTRTPATTLEYYQMPIIMPFRTTTDKGAKLKSVTVVATLGGTLSTTNDDFEINIVKVTTPVDASTPVGSVLAGDSGDDYPVAQNTKAKRLTAATHTFVVTIPEDEQEFIADGEQYYIRIKVEDAATSDLTCVLKGAIAEFDFAAL